MTLLDSLAYKARQHISPLSGLNRGCRAGVVGLMDATETLLPRFPLFLASVTRAVRFAMPGTDPAILTDQMQIEAADAVQTT